MNYDHNEYNIAAVPEEIKSELAKSTKVWGNCSHILFKFWWPFRGIDLFL